MTLENLKNSLNNRNSFESPVNQTAKLVQLGAFHKGIHGNEINPNLA